MPTIAADRLQTLASAVFQAAGAPRDKADCVAQSLVASDLEGHASHGLLRLPQYVAAIRGGDLVPNAEPSVVGDRGSTAVVDGNWGFGQVAAERAAQLAAERAGRHGLACVAMRRAYHAGRLSDYACIPAQRGFVALVFLNGHGRSELATPFGGAARRLSTNPICIAVPGEEGSPLVFDAATTVVSEGKVRVARNRGEVMAQGCLVDARGRPTTNPNDLYGPPPGALLLMGGEVGYKGFGLSLMTDILAGALSDAGCSGSGERGGNAMVIIAVQVTRFLPLGRFREHVRALCQHVKSAPLAPGANPILVPGEREMQARQRGLREGIRIDDGTWRQIVEAGESVGVDVRDFA
ncbi:MAG: Ldh family oxidoreductase [Armatimonadota bacterium]